MIGTVHGGVKFYRGAAGAARNYVEADRSRVDDYYLAEGTGLATRYVATASSEVIVEGGNAPRPHTGPWSSEGVERRVSRW